jgi:hypothetical protein
LAGILWERPSGRGFKLSFFRENSPYVAWERRERERESELRNLKHRASLSGQVYTLAQ